MPRRARRDAATSFVERVVGVDRDVVVRVELELRELVFEDRTSEAFPVAATIHTETRRRELGAPRRDTQRAMIDARDRTPTDVMLTSSRRRANRAAC